MAILRAVLATSVLATGCYSPQLRDCAVSCAANADCAPNQVCGGDHMCASPSIAGQCAQHEAGDAGVDGPGVDAARRDAAPTGGDAAPSGADAAPQLVQLHVQIVDKGRVVVDGQGTCDADTGQMGDCMFTVPRNVPITMHAVSTFANRPFEQWAAGPCNGSSAVSCGWNAAASTLVIARFQHPNGQSGGND